MTSIILNYKLYYKIHTHFDTIAYASHTNSVKI